MDDAALERFADLAVGFGANVQPDQIVAVECEPGKEYLVRAIAASAYRHGARFVDVAGSIRTSSAPGSGTRSPRRSNSCPVVRRAAPRSRRLRGRRMWASPARRRRRCSQISIPPWSARTGCRCSRRPRKSSTTARSNWTVVPCPTPAWAELVFPELDPAGALERLEREVLHVLRLDEEDPIAAWRARVDTLVASAARLTERRFDALHYAGPGTDWRSGCCRVALGGRALRDRRRARAHAEPAHGGGLHDTGSGADERHRDVDQAAGADRRHGGARPGRALRGRPGGRDLRLAGWPDAADADRDRAGAARLGECALVDREGRIGELGTVFYDTLLDENAASHIALGDGFRVVLDEPDRDRANESEIHIDFMIGSDELTVTGITASGDRVAVLADGRWQL